MTEKKQLSNKIDCDKENESVEKEVTPEMPIHSSEVADSSKDTKTKEPLMDDLKKIIIRFESIEKSLLSLNQVVERLVKQQEIMQNSMRQLGNRVTDAATALGAPRIRELYMRLLLIYDLVEPAPLHLSEESVSLCKLIATQIEQFLEVNGIYRIQTEKSLFDPIQHKPVKIISDVDPSKDGCVVSTVRNGFRSERAVLRPAEVVIVRIDQKEPCKVEEDTLSEELMRQEESQNHEDTENKKEEGDGKGSNKS